MNPEVEKLFHELADLPAEDRSRVLAARNVGVETRREVEALLAFDAGASSFLERDIGFAASHALPRLEPAGWRCGPYKIVETIGQGGMGAVYLAERADGEVTQRVAVKLLPPGSGEIHRERFLQERQILASLAHPNIARLVDAGRLDSGQPFLAMEYIDGKPIDEFAAGLPLRGRIELFLKVCAAVSDLHRNLVVHRDLKPGNILVTAEGEPKLLDFGIAKILDLEAGATMTGVRMLTPDYASPEQAAGGTITTATDIYSLGAVLYKMLTCRTVRQFRDRSPESIAQTVASGEVTMPAKLAPELKGDLECILLKALRKDPQERYATAEQLAGDLRAYLESRPVGARSGTAWYAARKFLRRNRAAAAMAAVALAASIAGVCGIWIQARAARAERDFALRQLSRAEAVNDLNRFVLSDAGPGGKAFTVDDLLSRAQRLVERQDKSQPGSVDLLTEIGRQYTVHDEYAKARQMLERAYQLSRSVADPSVRSKAACGLGQTLSLTGDPPRAERLIQEGLAALPDEPVYSEDRIFCLERGTEVASNRGDARAAIARAEAARAALKHAPTSSETAELNTLVTLAGAYGDAGRFREANAAFEQAAAKLTALGGDETQRAGILYNNWGVMMTLAGRPLDAANALRRSIDISQADGSEQGVDGMPLVNYARSLYELHRLDEAAGYAERGYAKANREGDEPAAGQSLLLRSSIYRAQGNVERAESMLAEVEPRLSRILPKGHLAYASLASEHSLNAAARRDFETALNYANQALAIVEALIKGGRLGADRLPLLLTRRAGIELDMNRIAEAAADAGRAAEMLRQSTEPGTFSTTLGRAHFALGRALLAERKNAEAIAEFRAAAEHLESALGPDHPEARSARALAEGPAGRK